MLDGQGLKTEVLCIILSFVLCIILGNKYTNNFITELKPLTFRLGVVHQTNNPSDQQFTF